MDESLYEQQHKQIQAQKETIAQLRKEIRMLKRALNEILQGLSGSVYSFGEFQAEMELLDKKLEKYRKLNLEVDEDETE